MASPKVIVRTQDISTRVPGLEGVYTAIVVPAKKGSVKEATLVTSDSDFLDRYTTNGRLDVGLDVSHYSAIAALERTNKLWVMRAHNGALSGGLGVSPIGASRAHTAILAGIEDLEETGYTFSNNHRKCYC